MSMFFHTHLKKVSLRLKLKNTSFIKELIFEFLENTSLIKELIFNV